MDDDLTYLKYLLILLSISLDFININNDDSYSINDNISLKKNNMNIKISIIKVFDNLILLHASNSYDDNTRDNEKKIVTLRIDPSDYLFDLSILFNDIKKLIDDNDKDMIKSFVSNMNPITMTYNLLTKINCNLFQPFLSPNKEYASLTLLSSYLVEHILSYSSCFELLQFGNTCKNFNISSNQEHLWGTLIKNSFEKLKILSISSNEENSTNKKKYFYLHTQRKIEEKNRLHRHFVAYGQAPLSLVGLPSNVPWIVGNYC